MNITVKGRVSDSRSQFETQTHISRDTKRLSIRIDDANNPNVWLEIELNTKELLAEIVGPNPCEEIAESNMYSMRENWMKGASGYVNQFGRRVGNPCGEIDDKGRDIDKINRWLKPGDSHTTETLDRLHAIEETDQVKFEMQERQRQAFIDYFRNRQPNAEVVETAWGNVPVQGLGQSVVRTCVKPTPPPMQMMMGVTEGIHPTQTNKYVSPLKYNEQTDEFWRQSAQASKVMKEKYLRQGESINDVVDRVVQEFELHLPDAE